MVNTRRSETIDSTPDINTQHRTRKRVGVETDSSSVCDSEEDSGNDEALPETQSKARKNEGIGRELRSRFIYGQHKYSSNRKRISLNDRHSLTVYSRNMLNGSDLYNGNDSDEEVYTRRRRRQRLTSHLTRIERRTALSLRPISQKCYADSLSESEVRRSKRQRKVQFENLSWLADDQMHKVGYPNLNVGYSEEDSREAPETHMEESRISTRHSSDVNSNKRRAIKNPKYLYDYETNNDVSQRRRSDRIKRPRRESNDKENKEEANLNGHSRPRRGVAEEDIEKKSDETVEDESNDQVQENGEVPKQEETDKKQNVVETKQESSGSDPLTRKIPATRSKRNTDSTGMNKKFYRRRKINRRPFVDSSDSESEERKSYSLRNRPPKPCPVKSLRTRELPPRRSRRRFTRRREVSSSSSSTSSDSERRVTKTPKSPHSKNETKLKSGGGGSKIIPIGPETLDGTVKFNSIGGLDGHIQCLKEMIMLPMMYPEVFQKFQVSPPRGVLFHGPPGTGKTLIARALANECSASSRKVSFFMRKGADLLSKWIGESEKQLRLLFEQASEMQPSIIFFDELDGLAPVRSSKQDQLHASIVSTLLALMDGLDSRGEVIVIGATNRIDAIDPALRRPGRFDRELYFPLPSAKEREAILRVHVSQWAIPPSDELLSYLAETSIGYCGSDLRALCSEAVIQGFRRAYPQVYEANYKCLLEPDNVKVEKVDFLRAKSLLVPASHRVAQGLGKKLLPILEPLLQDTFKNIFSYLEQTFPHATNPALSKVKLSPNIRPAQLILLGEGQDYGQTLHLAPAILYKMEHLHSYILDVATLYKDSGRSPEETCIQVFNEARRNVPSVVYIPNMDVWWSLVSEAVRVIVDRQISQLDHNIPILILATADTNYDNLPEEIQNIFSRYRKEVYQVDSPNESGRAVFFKSLLKDKCLMPPKPRRRRPQTPLPLPRAPTPPPTTLTEDQMKKLYEQEEVVLRELRIFLRDICKKLANNKLFYMFTKPVDTEEVPDYTTIIKDPMDLETMMTKVDFHKYECAKDFLTDIELICQNALEYNPARTSADKQIRHRACSLRDYAYTLIKNEMDSDFEDKCQGISKSRVTRKSCVKKFLPAYIRTPDCMRDGEEKQICEQAETSKSETTLKDKTEEKSDINSTRTGSSAKKRRVPVWQKGYLRRRKKLKLSDSSRIDDDKKESSDEESKDNLEINCVDATPPPEENTVEPTKPLSINCDGQTNRSETSSLHSPRRRLSDLMSPSELLANPLEFDDIDQALNEVEGTSMETLTKVHCDENELEELLKYTVEITAGCSLQSLLDLYNQLDRIVKKYSNTWDRTQLPKELSNELIRFKNEASLEIVSEGSQASSRSCQS